MLEHKFDIVLRTVFKLGWSRPLSIDLTFEKDTSTTKDY